MKVDWDEDEKLFIVNWIDKSRAAKCRVTCSACYDFVLKSAKARGVFLYQHVLSQERFAYIFQKVARGELN